MWGSLGLVAAVGAVMIAAPVTAQDPVRQVRAQLGAAVQADTGTAVALSAAFRAASERTLPAVVFIAVEQPPLVTREQLERLPPGTPGFGFREPRDPAPRTGSGSGFIIDTDGHILTNTHVVADASRVTVRLVDGREYVARVVGSDISSDIAVIRIDPPRGETLPVAHFGDSDALRVGDWVLALGSPLGLDFTVTAGIVSAKGRQIAQEGLHSFIQTDAVINPGNSGGPLIDLFGRVVGVNSAIFGSDRFIGYGFAVPITLAQRVLSDLLEFGHLRRPRLGVEVRAVEAVDAEIYGLEQVRGAFVAAVVPGEPAATAGVRAGDVILSVDGQPVRNDTDMITRLAALRPGGQVTLGIRRDRRDQQLSVRLGEFERPIDSPPPPAPTPADNAAGALGFTVRELTPEIAERLGYRGEGGTLVRGAVQYGAAWTVGIQPNTIVLAINGQRVSTPEQVARIGTAVRPGSAVTVTVYDHQLGAERVLNYRARQ
jgi:serine protease Do